MPKKNKWVVDTNVPITANLSTAPDAIPDGMDACVLACIELIETISKNGGLVLDAADEIFTEYMAHLHLSGQPGPGDAFLKWVHSNQWSFPSKDLVAITPMEYSYDEFPTHEGLEAFDFSDRKFVAVANAHDEKPPIAQATDSKWVGWEKALMECGIKVAFLCPEYIRRVYAKKMAATMNDVPNANPD